jgi:hypothetical protein
MFEFGCAFVTFLGVTLRSEWAVFGFTFFGFFLELAVFPPLAVTVCAVEAFLLPFFTAPVQS